VTDPYVTLQGLAAGVLLWLEEGGGADAIQSHGSAGVRIPLHGVLYEVIVKVLVDHAGD
jgi:hypothetical protein